MQTMARTAVGASMVVVALCSAAPVGAASPAAIEIADSTLAQDEALHLYPSLCTGEQVSQAAVSDRTSVELVVIWEVTDEDGATSEDRWEGRFYPRDGSLPAVVDVPEWRAYGGLSDEPATCTRRVVNPDVLSFLQGRSVPVDVDDLDENGRLLGAAPLVAGALVAVVGVALGVLRARMGADRQEAQSQQ